MNTLKVVTSSVVSAFSRKDALAFLLSACAFILSIVTFYETSVKPANITLAVGDRMEIYYDNDQALMIHLPIVFENTGARAGVVRSLGLILRDPGTKEAIFIKWFGFRTPTIQTWIPESLGTPLFVPGASDATKMAEFYGPGIKWLPEPKTYELYLLAWTSDSQKPSVILPPIDWKLSERDASAIKRNFEEGKTSGIKSTWINRSGYAPDSKTLTADDFDELVR